MKTSLEKAVAVLESWGGDGGTLAAQAEHVSGTGSHSCGAALGPPTHCVTGHLRLE